MNDRKTAVKYAKVGYVAIALMCLVNLMLSSFVFFEVDIPRVRELFLAIGLLMILIYASVYPTKLMESGSHLMKCAVFLILPLILILLIASPNNGAVSIVAYVINLVLTLFCTYISVSYERRVINYISNENYNDYVLLEHKTFKIQEVNIYTFAFIMLNFFVLLAGGEEVSVIAVCVFNLLVGFGLNLYRTKAAKSDRVKIMHYIFESISSLLAFVLVIVVKMLDLSSLIFIIAGVLLLPTLAVTILIYKSLDKFMYK